MPNFAIHSPPPAPVPPPTFTLEMTQEEAQALYVLLNYSRSVLGDFSMAMETHKYTEDHERVNARAWRQMHDAGFRTNGFFPNSGF